MRRMISALMACTLCAAMLTLVSSTVPSVALAQKSEKKDDKKKADPKKVEPQVEPLKEGEFRFAGTIGNRFDVTLVAKTGDYDEVAFELKKNRIRLNVAVAETVVKITVKNVTNAEAEFAAFPTLKDKGGKTFKLGAGKEETFEVTLPKGIRFCGFPQ